MNRLLLQAGLVLAGLTVLAGCSRKPATGPSAVVEKFYDDMAAGNVEEAKTLVTPETAEIIDHLVKSQGANALQAKPRPKASGERIDGDTAVVSFQNDDGSVATVPLVKMNDQWKIDFATVIDSAARARLPDPVKNAASAEED